MKKVLILLLIVVFLAPQSAFGLSNSFIRWESRMFKISPEYKAKVDSIFLKSEKSLSKRSKSEQLKVYNSLEKNIIKSLNLSKSWNVRKLNDIYKNKMTFYYLWFLVKEKKKNLLKGNNVSFLEGRELTGKLGSSSSSSSSSSGAGSSNNNSGSNSGGGSGSSSSNNGGNIPVVEIPDNTIAGEFSVGDFVVSPAGNNSNSGEMNSPLLTIKEALSRVQAGGTVFLREGIYNEKIYFPKSGTADDKITLKGYNSELVTITNSVNTGENVVLIDKGYIVLSNIIIDGEWRNVDIVKVKSTGSNLVLNNIEVKNTKRDAIDMDSPQNVVVINSKIHDALWLTENNGSVSRRDAHGLVTSGIKNLLVKNTVIYNVSGDALQFQYGGWNNIVIEDTQLGNYPINSTTAQALNIPSALGRYPGENAIDTKYRISDGRGKITIKNVTAYGWQSDFISNAAAFNMKHNIEAVFDGVTLYDSDIGFRLRGLVDRGNAIVTIKNAVIYDTKRAIRYEDNITDLHIYNNTFGDNVGRVFQSAGGHGSGFYVKNNLFLKSKPAEAIDNSNLAVSGSNFVDIGNNNYHLSANSMAINRGVKIEDVLVDRDGNERTGDFDIGAYEVK